MSILILEDDDLCRDMARNILHAAGFTVICAHHFEEAIYPIENGTTIDFALVDVKMPPGTPNGVCFARMAQLRRPKLKIIFMSAHVSFKDSSVFGEGEVFLPKPFAPQLLLDAVTRAAA
jgi:DNA-binding NtrC family response regulator